MILDKIDNSNLYTTLSANIAKGFEYIKNTDLAKVDSGTYDIGNSMKAIISEYDSKNEEDCKLEAHRKFIDIQFIIEGQEIIGYAPLKKQTPTIEYNDENDVVFYKDEVTYTKIEKGMFAIFFPTDLHQPCMKNGNSTLVKKLVIKIPV